MEILKTLQGCLDVVIGYSTCNEQIAYPEARWQRGGSWKEGRAQLQQDILGILDWGLGDLTGTHTAHSVKHIRDSSPLKNALGILETSPTLENALGILEASKCKGKAFQTYLKAIAEISEIRPTLV